MKPNEPIEIHRSIHLGNLLGEGGMGRVLDGFAPDLGQHLAVKQLRVNAAFNQTNRRIRKWLTAVVAAQVL